jgi:poly-gamma-glutamate synthesis protein (capsule biosynthesis protein)
MYFATLNPASGDLIQLRMTPMRIRKMRLNRAAPEDVQWLANRLARISMGFGAWVEEAEDGSLRLRWS